MIDQTETLVRNSLDMFDTELGDFFNSLSVENRIFVRKCIVLYPRFIQLKLVDKYIKGNSEIECNTEMRIVTDELNTILSSRDLIHLDNDDDQFRLLAERNALRCKRIGFRATNNDKSSVIYDPKFVYGENEPLSQEKMIFDLCKEAVYEYGLPVPTISKTVTVTGAIKRMQNTEWWLRKLRIHFTRKKEQVLICLGLVNKWQGKYCSDLTLKNRSYLKSAQLQMLENLYMKNELGEEFSLRDLHDKNVSNPVNRRNEFMTRMAGFEKLAKQLGHDATFVTFTCPSKYHNTYSTSGHRNSKWDGSTPYTGQQYLNLVWQRIRAELARQDIKIYGFRISEPQHDGTPHWHLILFVESENMATLKEISNKYSLEEDGDEEGAQEHRVKFKDIDPSKGSATGYVAKYISKNIDGSNLENDIDGGCAGEAAKRVEAWARCWGIRQFQQLGGASVTVWREMR